MNAPAPSPWRRAVGGFDEVLRPDGSLFYGWWIVLAGGGIQLLSGLLWAHSTGAYMVLLQDEFGWSATVISMAFALTRVESGLLGPIQGWLTDRFGPRSILLVGNALFGVGFMLFSLIDSVLTFFLTFAVIAVGASLGGFATLMVSIVSWFHRHRAKAIAASTMGFAVGGLMVPVVVWFLENQGWRATAFGSGAIILLIGLPLSLAIRHRPEDWGTRPDGTAAPIRREGEAVAPITADMTAGEAIRTSAFWLISFGHALALLIVSAVMLHLIAHLTNGLGYSLATAGLVVALMTGFQVVGQLFGGYLGDLFDKRVICALCMVAHASGLLLVTWATSVPMVIAFAVLHGMAWGARGPLMVALRADCFGSQAFGTIMGWSSLIVMFGMSGGPIVAGVMADATGDYVAGFTLLAGLSLFGAFCFLAIRAPQRTQRADSAAP